MDNEYWHQKWQSGDIRFNQSEVHPSLPRYFGSLEKRRVLVPLCGKTIDLIWLAQHGHEAIGVELSEIASRAFFEENKLTYNVIHSGAFKIFSTDLITLWCGNFFELPESALENIDAIYDRAALVALPKDLRARYGSKICDFVESSAQNITYLLITFEYDQDRADGPPHSVPSHEIHELFSKTFEFQNEDVFDALALSDHPKFVGVSALEKAYVMDKKG